MYKIEYHYQTGDSFHTEERSDLLEFEWKNLDVAKECLKRIREHYRWYESENNTYAFRHEKVQKPAWHNIKNTGHFKGHEHYLLNIPMDNGNEVQFWAPWCGYFERLYGAEIVTEGDTDMKFEL
jgi:hypothetical protein